MMNLEKLEESAKALGFARHEHIGQNYFGLYLKEVPEESGKVRSVVIHTNTGTTAIEVFGLYDFYATITGEWDYEVTHLENYFINPFAPTQQEFEEFRLMEDFPYFIKPDGTFNEEILEVTLR